jgi:hypothetical protein
MTDEANKKLTWWQFIKQDKWHLWFLLGFVALIVVLCFHFFIEEFIYLELTDTIGFNAVWIGVVLFGYWMISIAYKIFYKDWNKYLSDPKS